MQSSMHPIHARASDLQGYIEGELGPDGRPDLDAPYAAQLRLPVRAMRSGNRLQDMEMQRRIEARRYPTIDVRVGHVQSLDGSGRYRASLEVTAHGQTVPVEEDLVLQVEDGHLVVDGEHRFDMRDFGVDPPRFLALRVRPEVTVRAHIVAVEEATGDQQSDGT